MIGLNPEGEVSKRISKETKQQFNPVVFLTNAINNLERGGWFSPGKLNIPFFGNIIERIKNSNDPQIRKRFSELDLSLLERYFSEEILEKGIFVFLNDEEILKALKLQADANNKGEVIKSLLIDALAKLKDLLMERGDLILPTSS